MINAYAAFAAKGKLEAFQYDPGPISSTEVEIDVEYCGICHSDSTSAVKPGNHFVTARGCDACHRTTAWLPTTTYLHTSVGYRAHQIERATSRKREP